MTSYESDFDAVLNRGRVYGSAEQLRATTEGTPIADAEGRHWIRGFNDPAERRWRRRKAPRLIWVEIGGDHRRCPSSEIPLPRHTCGHRGLLAHDPRGGFGDACVDRGDRRRLCRW